MISVRPDLGMFSNLTVECTLSIGQSVYQLPVLVVEDCKVIAKITSRILTALGFDVEVACDGQQAVMACAERAFSFVLMDYQMPVMDGLEATALIREAEKHTGIHTPIIGYSTYADGATMLSAGMDDYLHKPSPPAVLGAKLASFFAPTGPARAM